MSAFIVTKSHIDHLIDVAKSGPVNDPAAPIEVRPDTAWYSRAPSWFAPRFIGDEAPLRTLTMQELQGCRRQAFEIDGDDLGQMLVDENVRSVSYRYSEDRLEDLPGPCDNYYVEPYCFPYRCRSPRRRMTAVEALKALGGYEYQACEHPGWEHSEAKSFCDALQKSLIDCLPGYDDAPWTWDDAS